MASWEPLRTKLARVDELTLTWADLDVLVGGLPASVSRHSAFWSGDRSMWSGFRTVNVVVGQTVTFVRFDGKAPVTSRPRPSDRPPAIPPRSLAPGDVDLVLVGCVKDKLKRPAPARDLYVSPLFAKERAYAEASGLPWFILSAEYGLVDPGEVVAPYDLRLSTTSAGYRRAWGVRVVERLALVAGPLDRKVIEVHAGSDYVDPIRTLLQERGAVVREPLDGLRFGPRLAWYNRAQARMATGNADASSFTSDVASFVAALKDESSSRTVAEFLATNGDGLRSPGLYSWWVDLAGAEELTRGLGVEVRPGMIYAGLAGATQERSGRQSSNTLWLRISGMHLGGKYEFSTLRLTLGSVLVPALGWANLDEARLSAWMQAHLRVIAIPVADADTLGGLESAVFTELDPPPNLSKVAATEVRRRITSMRRQYGRR